MLVQFMLLVDFAYSWNESWVGKAEEGSKCAGAGEPRTTVSSGDRQSSPCLDLETVSLLLPVFALASLALISY